MKIERDFNALNHSIVLSKSHKIKFNFIIIIIAEKSKLLICALKDKTQNTLLVLHKQSKSSTLFLA